MAFPVIIGEEVLASPNEEKTGINNINLIAIIFIAIFVGVILYFILRRQKKKRIKREFLKSLKRN